MSRWVAAVSAVLVVAALVMRALLPPVWSTGVPLLPDYAAGLAFPAVGAFILRHHPGHRLARLMCAGGLVCAIRVGAEDAMLTAAAAGHLDLAALFRYPAAIGRVAGGTLLAGLLPLYSPSGRLPSPRWRPVVVVAVALTVLESARSLVRPPPSLATYELPRVIPNPLAIEALAPLNPWVRDGVNLGLQAVIVLGLLSLIVRAQRAGPELRVQTAWPLSAFALYVVCLIAGPAFWVPCLAATAIVPCAIAFSVLRHRLFGVEVMLGKALVGAGVAGVISVAYLAASGLASLLVSGYGPVAGLAAALAAGAAFQPLRVRLRRLVDQAMYGPHGDPHRLARRLASEMRVSDPARALVTTMRVTADGLGVRGLAVRIHEGPTLTVGRMNVVDRELPLVWHGRLAGTLLIGPPGARNFTPEYTAALLWAALPYIADVTHAVRMCDDLRHSRARLATAREDERRLLRDGLHRELDQALDGVSRSLREAGARLRSSPSAADHLLGDVGAHLHVVAMRVRELLHAMVAAQAAEERQGPD